MRMAQILLLSALFALNGCTLTISIERAKTTPQKAFNEEIEFSEAYEEDAGERPAKLSFWQS